jgi:hypothetical protein
VQFINPWRKPVTDRDRRQQLKRLSLQIAAQLPEDAEEAKKVLHYAAEVVEWSGDQNPLPKGNNITVIK